MGVHFALSKKDLKQLLAFDDEEERLDFLVEEIEEEYFEKHRKYLAESDKAWDAMHRVLSDGTLTWEGSNYPLNHTVLAGELLYTGDDFIMSLKNSKQVKEINQALQNLSKEEFKERYYAIDPGDYGFNLTESDFDYTWGYFEIVRDFYSIAAKKKRAVLFTVD